MASLYDYFNWNKAAYNVVGPSVHTTYHLMHVIVCECFRKHHQENNWIVLFLFLYYMVYAELDDEYLEK